MAENVTAYAICGRSGTGHKKLVSGLAIDISYPIAYLYAGNISGQSYAVASGGTTTAFYTSIPGVNLQSTKASWTGTQYAMCYIKGTLSGTTFTVHSDVFTTTVPTSDDGFAYIPIGMMVSTTQVNFDCDNTVYMYRNGSFHKADTVSNYISADSTGIRIASASPSTQNQRLELTSSTLKMYDASNYQRLKLDSTNGVIIGKESYGHTQVTDTGLFIYDVNNKKRAQVDNNGLSVYLSDGTTSIANFGEVTRIGRLDAAHVEISQKALAVSTGGSSTDKRFIAGLANDPVTGLATVELFGVLDSIQIKSGVEYYAIGNGGIEPTSFTAIEIDGVSHSVTGLSYSDTAILLDKAEYASYSQSVAKITYATEDPVPTMFYGTSLNVNGVNTGSNSAAFGYTSSALGLASFAAGYNADAWGAYSAAIGRNSDAYGRDSAAFGYGTETEAKGIGSVALGYNAKTSAMFAISAGNGVVAQNLEETVLGAYNDYENDVNPYGRTQYNNRGKYALVIGNGTANNARSNALTVAWDGTMNIATPLPKTSGGTGQSGISQSTVTLSGCTVSGQRCWHNGVTCSVTMIDVKLSSALGNGNTVAFGTIPSGYRPSEVLYDVASSPNATFCGRLVFRIDQNGQLSLVNRSGSNLPANTAFSLFVTYAI